MEEDIKILKELVENKEKYEIPDGYKTHYCIGFTMIKSIENVLSEVEEYQKHKKYHCEQLEKVLSDIESFKNRENKELETYKKIVEKLAEYGVNCAYGIPVKFKDTDELMAIVREEVENEINKARYKNT